MGNLFVTGLNKRDKETNRVSRIVKFKTCFRIKENKLARKGIHTAYVRIAMPDKSILYNSAENLFDYQGEKIVYTAMRQFDYQNKDMDLCIYYKHETPELVQGIYHVDVFLDGTRITAGEFQLK